MVQFFQTHMGQKFYERDIPEMVRKLNEIADLDVGSNTVNVHVHHLRKKLGADVICRFQKTAALNVRSRLHYSSGGVGSIRQRRAAAGQ